ncbi:MAG: serine/threonine-protein kinase [Deltaproteobacteria bacterium]|nr:serine/threonine-protein kinase [Deltaproteobacteria bacterium]
MSESPESKVGEVIAGRYRLLKVLGQGGIGAVYLAEPVGGGEQVAVKLLKSEFTSDRETVARFDREAKVMTSLVHENIVRAWEFGRLPSGDVAMVMERVEGETLRSVYNHTRPLPPWIALEISRQMGGALRAAHSQGIVHRDLKPENVMVRRFADGRLVVKVLDFGMARMLFGHAGAPLTKDGAVFGTPEYMPPEQAMGKPVDAQADQYAFGVIVFEMIAGKRPFKAASLLELLQMQIRQAPPSLRTLDPATPEAVSEVVLRMMAKNPAHRFADIGQAVEALLEAGWPSLRVSHPGLAPRPSKLP